MKIKYFQIVLMVFLTLNSHAQNFIHNNDLTGEWFVSNEDSSFFKADTLTFIKRTNKAKNYVGKEKNRPFIEPNYFPQYVNIKFQANHEIRLWESFDYGYMNAGWVFLYSTWRLKKDTIILMSDTFKWKFKCIAISQIQFKHLISNYPKDEYETLTTPTIKLVRIK